MHRTKVLQAPSQQQQQQQKILSLTWRHEIPEYLWNYDTLFGLVRLQDSTHYTCGGTHGCVEHVHIVSLKNTGSVVLKLVQIFYLTMTFWLWKQIQILFKDWVRSPCPSSFWSVRSGYAADEPGSLNSWSRRPALWRLRTLGTRPPSPAFYWLHGSEHLGGSRQTLRLRQTS